MTENTTWEMYQYNSTRKPYRRTSWYPSISWLEELLNSRLIVSGCLSFIVEPVWGVAVSRSNDPLLGGCFGGVWGSFLNGLFNSFIIRFLMVLVPSVMGVPSIGISVYNKWNLKHLALRVLGFTKFKPNKIHRAFVVICNSISLEKVLFEILSNWSYWSIENILPRNSSKIRCHCWLVKCSIYPQYPYIHVYCSTMICS